MQDKYGREIDYIRLSVTDRCNLRCVYCMPEEGIETLAHESILSYAEITRLCSLLAELGIRKIKITGGEPLVRKDLAYLIRDLKNISEIEEITLTTNGILLANQADELIDAGISAVNISLDTLNPEHYKELTRCGDVGHVLQGIESVLQRNIKAKINCVPNYVSDKEIIELALLAYNKPLHVRFIELMPIGIGKSFLYNKAINHNQEDRIRALLTKEFGKLSLYKEKLGNGPSSYIAFPHFQGKIGFISAISHKFCKNCNRIRLTSAGFLKSCLQYEIGENLFNLLREKKSDAEIKARICKALEKKPLGHEFDNEEKQGLGSGMSQIGG